MGDVGTISNLWGGRHLEGTFFLKKKGAFSNNKNGTSLFIARSWEGERAPSAPAVSTSVFAGFQL